MIDLRSDTLTKPSQAMREAMANAEVGDDVYAEDPSVTQLEERTAELLGHEAGLFCATGTLTNLLGVWSLVKPGEELLLDESSHIIRAELGGHAVLSGVTTRTWYAGGTGLVDLDRIADLISPTNTFLVPTGAAAIENTHNFGGGTILPLDFMKGFSELCLERGIGRHLDAARLWNAHVETGVSLREYGSLFDTVSICYSKGLGAPVGSVLVGSADLIAKARLHRRRLGGSWRQAGILAAAALYALDHNVERLVDDHANAKILANGIAEKAEFALGPNGVETNIVVLNTGTVEANELAAGARDKGVRVSVVGPRTVRAVTHLDVTADDCAQAGEALGEVLSTTR